MSKILVTLGLCALLGSCATYTERTSPCVCLWEPIGTTEEAAV